jgi:2'-5' RNA ligase
MHDNAFGAHDTNVKKDLLFAKKISIIVSSNHIVMTGYHDYLIILAPPENIANYVKGLKDFSAGIIGEYESRFSRAHITVQPWPRKRPVWIEPLLPKLERDLQTLPPLVMDINGFDYFDHQEQQTIYARLVSTPQTKVWFKLLRKFFSTPPFEPHITIARSIGNNDFRELWPHFKKRSFNGQMQIDKLTILRRETIGYDKTYKVFKEIPFNHRLDFNEFTALKLKTPERPLITVKDKQQISLF